MASVTSYIDTVNYDLDIRLSKNSHNVVVELFFFLLLRHRFGTSSGCWVEKYFYIVCLGYLTSCK